MDQQIKCSHCGFEFPAQELTFKDSGYICVNCQQAMAEALKPKITAGVHYGGFWMRALAKIIDGTIELGLLWFASSQGVGEEFRLFFKFFIPIAYSVFMVGAYGATIGKMACGLKIVRDNGKPVGYALALGRRCSEILSAVMLFIGYFLAAFDKDKRTLHDRICKTRVIYSRFF